MRPRSSAASCAGYRSSSSRAGAGSAPGAVSARTRDAVAVQQAGERLHVEIGAGVAAGDELDRDLARRRAARSAGSTSVCGAIGTSTQPAMPGCSIGPPADSAYAVEPVGEATIRPSARWLATKWPSMSTLSSTMLEVAPRLTTTSFIASAVEDRTGRRACTPRVEHACARSSSYSPASIGVERARNARSECR